MCKTAILPLCLVALCAVLFNSATIYARETKDDEFAILKTHLEEMRESFEVMKEEYESRFQQMEEKISNLEKENERLEVMAKSGIDDAAPKAPSRGGCPPLFGRADSPRRTTPEYEIASPSARNDKGAARNDKGVARNDKGAAGTDSFPDLAFNPSNPMQIFSAGKSYMNVSFDALFDFGASTSANIDELERGDHDPKQRGITLPNEELFIDGAADPYFKGATTIVYKLDEDNETEIELEEAYITSLSLPWNLQLKAGQFLTEFGRLNQQHPHQWDFVDQPLANNRMFGPDGLRSPGARVSWLMPTPFYSEAYFAVLNSQGGTTWSFRNKEEEALYGRTGVDRGVRNFDDMLFVPRLASSVDLTDSQTILLGASAAIGPNSTGMGTNTQIYGFDLFWKWKPPTQSGGWPFVTWQTEGMYRRLEAGADSSVGLSHENLDDWGMYSQAVWGFKRRWTAGLRGDFVTGESGDYLSLSDSTGTRPDRVRISPVLTFYPSEFTKLRLQYNYDEIQSANSEHSVFFQLEFSLGAHAAHKF